MFAVGCSGREKNQCNDGYSVIPLYPSSRFRCSILRLIIVKTREMQAHSATEKALNRAGDVYVPSQRVPTLEQGEKKLTTPQTADFLDFTNS